MVQNPLAYVEAWDRHDFPDLEERTIANQPEFLTEPVELEHGLIPDQGGMVTGWIVTRGFLRVAHALWESADNPELFESRAQEWINTAKAAEREKQKDWRRGREAEIAAHPDIANALEHSPETLYDRARLSDPQRSAMRLFCQADAEGRFNGYKKIAGALNIDRDEARNRVQAAIDKILAIGTEAD